MLQRTTGHLLRHAFLHNMNELRRSKSTRQLAASDNGAPVFSRMRALTSSKPTPSRCCGRSCSGSRPGSARRRGWSGRRRGWAALVSRRRWPRRRPKPSGNWKRRSPGRAGPEGADAALARGATDRTEPPPLAWDGRLDDLPQRRADPGEARRSVLHDENPNRRIVMSTCGINGRGERI